MREKSKWKTFFFFRVYGCMCMCVCVYLRIFSAAAIAAISSVNGNDLNDCFRDLCLLAKNMRMGKKGLTAFFYSIMKFESFIYGFGWVNEF
jgi:hypothetical protein